MFRPETLHSVQGDIRGAILSPSAVILPLSFIVILSPMGEESLYRLFASLRVTIILLINALILSFNIDIEMKRVFKAWLSFLILI